MAVWECLVPWCRSRAILCYGNVAEAQLQDRTLKGNTNVNEKENGQKISRQKESAEEPEVPVWAPKIPAAEPAAPDAVPKISAYKPICRNVCRNELVKNSTNPNFAIREIDGEIDQLTAGNTKGRWRITQIMISMDQNQKKLTQTRDRSRDQIWGFL